VKRRDAHRVWLGYRGVEAFAFGLGWTVAPVFFIRELDFSPLQLVLAGTALEVAYFVFEIPTGVVADTYGRRLSVILGVLGLGLGFVATGLAGGVGLVLAAAAFMGFAWTFKSGAEDAWITDEVGVDRSGRAFQGGAQAARAGGLLGIGAAVALALVDLRLPIVAGGVVLVVLAGALVLLMPETSFRSARREDVSAVASMAGTARHGGGLIRRRPLLLLIVGIYFCLGVSDEGFDRLWEAQFLLEVGVGGGGGGGPGGGVGGGGRGARGSTRWSGSGSSPPERRCSRSLSRSRSSAASPRWARLAWRARCWCSTCSGSPACSRSRLRARSRSHSLPSGSRGSPARSRPLSTRRG
jgi:MFS family permease